MTKVKRLQFGVNWTDVSTREPSANDVVSWRDVEPLIVERDKLKDMVIRFIIAHNAMDDETTPAVDYDGLIKDYTKVITDMQLYHDDIRYGFNELE
ncbi:MAG: hypothetical protein KKB59_19815 [Spirochaetes bacterium]|nr:hypothetical protein [Spirochaetota bacterium]